MFLLSSVLTVPCSLLLRCSLQSHVPPVGLLYRLQTCHCYCHHLFPWKAFVVPCTKGVSRLCCTPPLIYSGIVSIQFHHDAHGLFVIRSCKCPCHPPYIEDVGFLVSTRILCFLNDLRSVRLAHRMAASKGPHHSGAVVHPPPPVDFLIRRAGRFVGKYYPFRLFFRQEILLIHLFL